MLTVLFSWMIIAGAAFIFGKAVTDGLYRKQRHVMGRPDIYLVTGLIFLNVYAQFFSLFYKVSGIACTILGAVGVAAAVVWAYKWLRTGGKVMSLFPGLSRERAAYWRWAAFALCFLFTVLCDVLNPVQYDTGLYHAHAIRWIEEYAVVPGLGNLHMRLAYNSAFMCLQALFSLEWLVGQSLHTLNGFLCLMALAYVCFTVKIQGKDSWQVSDLLKCIMLFWVVQMRYDISSSGTDICTMLLIFYIFIKWSEYMENGEKDAGPYGHLALIGVYAVTVKLSAASVVVLAVFPAYLYLKEKRLPAVLAHAAGGFFILLPWLIRNVILSGFLIYPIGELDFFNVDWKMDRAVLDQDRLDIKMYARGTPRAADYENSFAGWICKWFLNQTVGDRVLILLGAACVPILLYLLWRNIRERRLPESMFLGAALLNTAFWLFSAPLMRYGGTYLYILIAVTAGTVGGRYLKGSAAAVKMVIFLGSIGLYATILPQWLQGPGKHFVSQPEYISRAATEYPLGKMHIWMPDGGDMIGYWAFPATPNKWQYETLRMRGETFQEGFSHE